MFKYNATDKPSISFKKLVENTRKSQQKYINPIPVVMGLIYKGDKILVVKQNKSLQYWHFVAGFMNAGESAEQATEREVLEETNLKVKVREIIGTFPYQRDTIQIHVVFKLDYKSGKLKPQDDIVEAKWIDIKQKVKFKTGSLSEYIYKNCIKNNQRRTKNFTRKIKLNI